MGHPATPLVALVHTSSEPRTLLLLARAARTRPVIVVEEAVVTGHAELRRETLQGGIIRIQPLVPAALGDLDADTLVADLLAEIPELAGRSAVDLWVNSPMLVPFADELPIRLTVFDYSHDLVSLPGAPHNIRLRERDLFGVADVVFAAGTFLYGKARTQHDLVHLLPSAGEMDGRAEERWDEAWARIDSLMAGVLARRAGRAGRAGPQTA